MSLLDIRGGYLYQHQPSLFPEGQITQTELALWELYYHDKQQRLKSKNG